MQAGPSTLLHRAQHAESAVALDLELGDDPADLDPHDWIVDQGAAASAEPPRCGQKFVDGGSIARHPREGGGVPLVR